MTDYILTALASIVTAVLLFFAKKLVALFEKKTGLEVTQKQVDLIDLIVRRGVAYAEEQSRKEIKDNNLVLEGSAKQRLAVEFATNAMREYGLAGIDPAYLTKVIEAHVNFTRTPVYKKAL